MLHTGVRRVELALLESTHDFLQRGLFAKAIVVCLNQALCAETQILRTDPCAKTGMLPKLASRDPRQARSPASELRVLRFEGFKVFRDKGFSF